MQGDQRIELFRHNQEAYDKLCILLKKYRKACIVHPTGTGKSFIAFKYIEENPDKRILWISPSNIIFNTQMTGLIEVIGKQAAERIAKNLRQITYTFLAFRKSFTQNLKCDVIVLDEFHRCGAPVWEKMVKLLIGYNENPILIGLSATHIRYLDCNRNMADELFDGVIASKMTLHDALERSILKTPKYITANYSNHVDMFNNDCKSIDLQNIFKRKLNNEIVRDLNQSIGSAAGIRSIFAKYIIPGGRYIVFCTSLQQLKEIEIKLYGWCLDVDAPVRIYKVTWKEDVDKALRLFKEDDSKYVKFLMCVNILTEGYHINNIDGIIMMRLTRSPNVYIQQIGRIMSAVSTKESIILDIANNYQSSIQTISMAWNYNQSENNRNSYKKNEEPDRIGKLQVKEEPKSHKDIIKKLKNLSTESWEAYYLEAKAYYEKNGDLNLDESYTSENGMSLGMWLEIQRRLKRGELKGQLTLEKVRLLEKIGIDWDWIPASTWDKESWIYKTFDTAIECLRKYLKTHLNTLVPYNYEIDGFRLGQWVCEARAKYTSKYRESPQKLEQKKQLDELGFIWYPERHKWDFFYNWLTKYKEEHGIINIKKGKYVFGKYGDAYIWLITQMRKAREGKLPSEKIQKLEMLDIAIDEGIFTAWDIGYAKARAFYEKYGTLDLTNCYVRDNSFDLGGWLRRQRSRKKYLTEDQIRQLDDIGMLWTNHRRLTNHGEKNLRELDEYYREHGNIEIPMSYVTESGIMLGLWLRHQKELHNRLSKKRVDILENYGINWDIWDDYK